MLPGTISSELRWERLHSGPVAMAATCQLEISLWDEANCILGPQIGLEPGEKPFGNGQTHEIKVK